MLRHLGIALLVIAVAIFGGLSSSAESTPDTIGYGYAQVERTVVALHARLPTPGPFDPIYKAAVENRDWFEINKATPKRPAGRIRLNELDTSGAGRPSRWYVRNDGAVRVDYNAFGTRFTLIFKPKTHELITLDPTKRTYEIADTVDDSFMALSTPSPNVKLPRPPPFGPLQFESLGSTSIDGRNTQAYRSFVKTQGRLPIEVERLDYVSALPRPHVIPFPGIEFFPTLIDALLIRDGREESPGGLVLYRAIRLRQADLSQAFEKNPTVIHAHDGFSICQRGNIANLPAADNSLFEIPPGYTEGAPRHRNLRFGESHETDDFLAFHECD